MPRKKTILDDLVALPWWFNLALAAITYFSLKYWLPAAELESQIFRGVVEALPNFAGIFAGLLIMIAAISAVHSWRKGALIENQTSIKSIRHMSWKDFEFLVSEAYRRKGFTVVENSSDGPDGGIDLILLKDSEKILVQCENWKSRKVGVSVVRELLGVVMAERASRGVVVCSGNYTRGAIDFANNNNIELISGRALVRLISTVQKKKQTHVKNKITDCPVCRSHMVHRTARKGKNSGINFLGCSRFPKCRGARDL